MHKLALSMQQWPRIVSTMLSALNNRRIGRADEGWLAPCASYGVEESLCKPNPYPSRSTTLPMRLVYWLALDSTSCVYPRICCLQHIARGCVHWILWTDCIPTTCGAHPHTTVASTPTPYHCRRFPQHAEACPNGARLNVRNSTAYAYKNHNSRQSSVEELVDSYMLVFHVYQGRLENLAQSKQQPNCRHQETQGPWRTLKAKVARKNVLQSNQGSKSPPRTSSNNGTRRFRRKFRPGQLRTRRIL
jgi:hypothetical protein